MKILGTGFSGLVGSRIIELLSGYEFEILSREKGFDITNKQQVYNSIQSSSASIVMHLAAKTNVDECEKEKHLGKDSEAWRVNVDATDYISQACKEFNKKLFYVSTDFVFDGKNPPEAGYGEEDTPSPINWYGQTKYEGEQRVEKNIKDFIILRITYPYRSHFDTLDFVRTIIARLSRGEEVKGITNQIITPTFIDDIAIAIDVLLKEDRTGKFHIVGSQWISPYDAGVYIAKTFDLNQSLIKGITAQEYFSGRASRPLLLKTKNDKIRKLGVYMKTFQEGILEVKRSI